MILIVPLHIHSASTAAIKDSGMLIATINALRQSRKNSKIISAVSNAPSPPSSVRPPIARVT